MSDSVEIAACERASRRFTRVFLAILVMGMMTSAGLALAIDPLHTFGTGKLPALLTAERELKPEAFLNLDPSPQVLVLGSSRVMKLAPACITDLTGLRAFNFGLSRAHVEDLVAAFRFARARGNQPLRRLIIGLDAEMFDNSDEADPRLLTSAYLHGYVDGGTGVSLGAAVRSLFGWQTLRYSIASLYHYARTTKHEDKLRFGPDGLVTYTKWEAAVRAGTFAEATERAAMGNYIRAQAAGSHFDRLSAHRVALFADLVRTAHDAGIAIDAYIPPLHPALEALRTNGLLHDRLRDLDAMLTELERTGMIRYFRFRRPEDFGGAPDGYFDGAHMTDANARLLLLALFQRDRGCA